MTAPDVHMLTGADALDAVTDLEQVAFDRHLHECPVCEQEVREFRETAALLGAAISVEPGTCLRERVLTQVGATRQMPPVVTDIEPARARSSRRWVKRAGISVLAAAAAAALVIGGVNLGQPAVPAGSVVSASDAVTVTARGAAGGEATAVVSRREGQFVLDIRDLPAPDNAHTYQGWLVGPLGPQSAGLLHAGGRTGAFSGDIPSDTKQIVVTTEPAAGSPQPTTPGVVTITLA